MTPDRKSGPAPGDADAAAVARIRHGDLDAFDELVRRYEHRIVNYIGSITSRSVDAEDVAQEVFLRAYRGLRTFRGQSSFKTWLYQIATNTARTHAQKSGRRREDAVGTLGDEGPEGHPPARSSEDLEGTLILRDRIDRALAQLPEDQRQAVVLRDAEGLEYKEISELLRIPMGTVESRIFRARARLRELLGPTRRGE